MTVHAEICSIAATYSMDFPQSTPHAVFTYVLEDENGTTVWFTSDYSDFEKIFNEWSEEDQVNSLLRMDRNEYLWSLIRQPSDRLMQAYALGKL